MALYKILFMPSTEKDFKKIPRKDLKKILQRIDSLAIDPQPLGCEKLTGQNKYRVRQGNYRIIYTINNNELIVWIVKVGHRKNVYRVSEEKEKFTSDNPEKKQ